jgi:hypothetical protein
MPRVYLIDSDQPSAFATGRNPQHAAVAVTRGLLNTLPEQEDQRLAELLSVSRKSRLSADLRLRSARQAPSVTVGGGLVSALDPARADGPAGADASGQGDGVIDLDQSAYRRKGPAYFMRPASGYRMRYDRKRHGRKRRNAPRLGRGLDYAHAVAACYLDRVGRCGGVSPPSNIGKWCAIGQHQLHVRLRRLPYRHDEVLYKRSLAAVSDDRTAR